MKVLVVTPEWPTEKRPFLGAYVVSQVEHLKRIGVDVDVFPFRGAKRPWKYAKAWWQLRRRHNLVDYDVVHAHFGHSGLVVWPHRVDVVTFHGSDLQGILNANNRYTALGWLIRSIGKFFYHRAYAAIVVAERMRQHVSHGPPVFVIPGGVDLTVFRPIDKAEARAQLQLRPDIPIILFAASRFRPVKRFELAAAAVSRLPPDLGVELLTLEGVPPRDVPIYMSACDVLLLTSRHEGSPGVVKEALACNLPVVSVDVGDVRERLHNVNHCFVCGEEPEELAAALERVLAAAARSDGRDHVSKLEESEVARRVFEVYQLCIVRKLNRGNAHPVVS